MAPKKIDAQDLKFAILATDVVCFRVVDGRLCVLIGKTQSSVFAGTWALVGGLISPEETAEQSAERHLSAKAGIRKVYKEQLYTFSAIGRDPRGRVVSVAYIALASGDPQEKGKAGIETRWCPVGDLPRLAYDHDEIVAVAVARLQARLAYTTVARHLLPAAFTMSDLQALYETVLGRGVDKRNFRKKALASQTIEETGEVRKQGVMRPAALYRFSSSAVQEADML